MGRTDEEERRKKKKRRKVKKREVREKKRWRRGVGDWRKKMREKMEGEGV